MHDWERRTPDTELSLCLKESLNDEGEDADEVVDTVAHSGESGGEDVDDDDKSIRGIGCLPRFLFSLVRNEDEEEEDARGGVGVNVGTLCVGDASGRA